MHRKNLPSKNWGCVFSPFFSKKFFSRSKDNAKVLTKKKQIRRCSSRAGLFWLEIKDTLIIHHNKIAPTISPSSEILIGLWTLHLQGWNAHCCSSAHAIVVLEWPAGGFLCFCEGVKGLGYFVEGSPEASPHHTCANHAKKSHFPFFFSFFFHLFLLFCFFFYFPFFFVFFTFPITSKKLVERLEFWHQNVRCAHQFMSLPIDFLSSG